MVRQLAEMEDLMADITETLGEDWVVLPSGEAYETGLPIVGIGFTASNDGHGDHARYQVKAHTDGTVTATGYLGTLTLADEFYKHDTFAHMTFEDNPDEDLSAFDGVRSHAQIVCESVTDSRDFGSAAD